MTITVTPVVEPSTGPNDPPRIRLNIYDGTNPARAVTTVTRIDPDGSVVPVRTEDGGPQPLSGRAGVAFDYEAPFGQAVVYSSVESPNVVSAPVTLDEQEAWLIHPGVPVLSRPILAAGITGRTRRVERAVLYPMARRTPAVQSDGQRKASEYTLTIRTTTEQDRIAVDLLFDDASTLLLNVPAAWRWGIGAEYVAVGDTLEDRLYPYAPEQRRTWTLPLIVVDRPVGGAQSERTFADVLADNASFDQLMVKYPTFLALQAGP